jgi:transposase
MCSQTPNGANASATLYSIIESAKANSLVPYNYLLHVMNPITAGNTDPEKLLPWNVNLS